MKWMRALANDQILRRVIIDHGKPPPKRERACKKAASSRLEALAVDDGRARLVVLLLGDPHLLEGRERREDRAADPDLRAAEGRERRVRRWQQESGPGRAAAAAHLARLELARLEPAGGRTEYLRSGGAMILTFIEAGARAVISFDMRSAMPEYMVVPPERTTFA